jgi:hypothetical protein
MRASSALVLALGAALWCAAARAQLAVTLATSALTGASTALGEVVVPALQFAARGSRGVQERATYARYIARGPYAAGWRNLPAVPKTEGDWSWELLSSLVQRRAFSTTFAARVYYPVSASEMDIAALLRVLTQAPYSLRFRRPRLAAATRLLRAATPRCRYLHLLWGGRATRRCTMPRCRTSPATA